MNALQRKTPRMTSAIQKVLVVDDDPVICEFMERTLSHDGYEVLTVRDGLSALDVLHFHRPHIIFLDVVLPDMDGRSLCRILRNKKELQPVFIALFSGILLENQPNIVELGADVLIGKGPASKMLDYIREVLHYPNEARKRCLGGEIIGAEYINPRKMMTDLFSSKSHFALILQKMKQGILKISPDGRILFGNKSAIRFLKCAEVELLASLFMGHFNKSDRTRVAEFLKFQGKPLYAITDDDPIFLNDRFFAMEILPRGKNGGNLTVIMSDVTLQKLKREALKAGEERLWQIIYQFSDAVIIADVEGIVRLVNPAAAEMFGRDTEAFIGSSFGFPLPAGETSDLDILSRDGTWKAGEMRSVEIQWEGKKACLASIRDITRRKRMEEDLRNANQKILEQQEKLIEEERLKVLLQMSGATAHELNQPLSILLGNIDLMRDAKNDPEELALCIDEIEKAGRRISDTIKKIQNIRQYETRPYGHSGRIVDLNQALHILSIESSHEDFKTIQSVLNGLEGIALNHAENIEQGLRYLQEKFPNLVLLDYQLPDGNGFDFLRAMRKNDLDIPVVFLTGQGDEMVASRLIQEGAYDYLSKTRFDRETIASCIRNVMEKANLKKEIRTAQRRISDMATRDELTGLFNRRYFMEALEQEKSRAERHGTDLTFCMIDLDFFKRINDTWGHTAGDEVLADMGRMIRQWSRQTDVACRYGGEEFGVILPETSLEGGRVACERLRRMVEEARVPWRTGPIQFTISLGVSQDVPGEKGSLRKLIDQADEALYRAKEAGRNRVMVFQSL